MLKYLSTTLIGNYSDCPKRALTSHFDRQIHGDDNEGTDSTRFGTVLHNVMENIHRRVMVLGRASVTEADILAEFDSQWQLSTCTDFDFYELGRNKIVEFAINSLDRRIGVTIAVELEFVYDVEANETFVCMPDMPNGDRNYYAKLVRDRGHTPVVSKIDRIDRVSDTEFEIFDYKSNIIAFTRDEIENSKQLGIYDLVVRSLYPEAEKVWCVYDMFRHGRFPVEFPDHFRDNLRAYLSNLWVQMLQAVDAEKFEEKTNKYCRWCNLRAKCSAYQKLLEYETKAPVLVDSVDTPEGINALYDEYQRLLNSEKAVETRKSEISAMLSAKIERDGLGEPIVMGEREFYLQANVRYAYNTQVVFDAFKAHQALTLLPQVISVSSTSLKNVLKARKNLFDLIEEQAKTKNFVKPTPKARKVKAGTLKTGADQDAE